MESVGQARDWGSVTLTERAVAFGGRWSKLMKVDGPTQIVLIGSEGRRMVAPVTSSPMDLHVMGQKEVTSAWGAAWALTVAMIDDITPIAPLLALKRLIEFSLTTGGPGGRTTQVLPPGLVVCVCVGPRSTWLEI